MFLNLCKNILRVVTVPVLVTILHMGSFEEVSLLKEKILFCDIKSIGYDMCLFLFIKFASQYVKFAFPTFKYLKRSLSLSTKTTVTNIIRIKRYILNLDSLKIQRAIQHCLEKDFVCHEFNFGVGRI